MYEKEINKDQNGSLQPASYCGLGKNINVALLFLNLVILSALLFVGYSLLSKECLDKEEVSEAVGVEVVTDGYEKIGKEEDAPYPDDERGNLIIAPSDEGVIQFQGSKISVVEGEDFSEGRLHPEMCYRGLLQITFDDGTGRILDETSVDNKPDDCFYAERIKLKGLSPDGHYVIYQKGMHNVLRYYMLEIQTGEHIEGFDEIYSVQDIIWSEDYRVFAVATIQVGYGGVGETAVYLGDENGLVKVWGYEPTSGFSPYADVGIGFIGNERLGIKVSKEEAFFIDL